MFALLYVRLYIRLLPVVECNVDELMLLFSRSKHSTGCPSLSVDRVWQVSSSNRVLSPRRSGADDIRGAPSGCKVMKRVLGSGWRYTVSNLGQSSKPQSEGFVRFDYNREEYSRSNQSAELSPSCSVDECRDGLNVANADTWYV